MEDEKFYAEINLKFDSTKKSEKQQQIVKGDEITISSLIGALIHNLLESGFDRHMLEHAIEEGLKEKKKIQVKEIHITKENAKDFEELLKKLTREG
ncbi:MAG: hypothetical protein IKQ33_03085 [Clostridia bacterium]|nr:hypothetical protein [Clostridia bacterium]